MGGVLPQSSYQLLSNPLGSLTVSLVTPQSPSLHLLHSFPSDWFGFMHSPTYPVHDGSTCGQEQLVSLHGNKGRRSLFGCQDARMPGCLLTEPRPMPMRIYHSTEYHSPFTIHHADCGLFSCSSGLSGLSLLCLSVWLALP